MADGAIAVGFSQTEVAPGVINFAVGTPGVSLIPKKELDQAFSAALAANQDPLIYQVLWSIHCAYDTLEHSLRI